MPARLRPRLTFANVVALLALFVALGGAAALASSSFVGSNGTIRACVGKGGALSVVKAGHGCKHHKRSLALSAPPKHAVRQRSITFHFTCIHTFGSNYICTAPAQTVTARCKTHERATGGGFGKADDSSVTVSPSESRPNPASGTPTGWTITASASSASTSSSRPDAKAPVYADCALP